MSSLYPEVSTPGAPVDAWIADPDINLTAEVDRWQQEAQLQDAISQGNTTLALQYAAESRGVQPIDDLKEWPTGTTIRRASQAPADSELRSLVAGETGFVADEATMFAQEQALHGRGVTYTAETLSELAADRSNPLRGAASQELSTLYSDRRSYQAEVAAARVGWTCVLKSGHFVACPPDGDVLYGKGDALAMSSFLKEFGYDRMPVDDPHALPLLGLMADRSGVPVDELIRRGSRPTQVSDPERAALSETKVLPKVDITATLGMGGNMPTTVLARVEGADDLLIGGEVSPFEVTATLGRLLCGSVHPDTAAVRRKVLDHMNSPAVFGMLPDFTADEDQVVRQALQAAIDQPDSPDHYAAQDALAKLDGLF